MSPLAQIGCVLASTAGPGASVVAALAQGYAPFSREVAQQTREEQREEGHGGPPDAAVRLRTREGFIRTSVFVIAGAVVEKRLDAASARPVLNRAPRRAHAPPTAHPAGWEHPWAGALGACAPTAVGAFAGVYAFKFRGCIARHGHHLCEATV